MKDSKFTQAYLKILKEENENNMNQENKFQTSQNVGEDAELNEQVITFRTSDPTLIDAINSGFDEAVFFVKAKDEETGEETVQEVKFGPESFKDFEIKDAADSEEEQIEGEDFEEQIEGEDTVDEDTIDEDTIDEDTIDEEPIEECDEGECNSKKQFVKSSEWLEDGICVKCGNPKCDGSCKCKKCGSENCIGDCKKDEQIEEFLDPNVSFDNCANNCGNGNEAALDPGSLPLPL